MVGLPAVESNEASSDGQSNGTSQRLPEIRVDGNYEDVFTMVSRYYSAAEENRNSWKASGFEGESDAYEKMVIESHNMFYIYLERMGDCEKGKSMWPKLHLLFEKGAECHC